MSEVLSKTGATVARGKGSRRSWSRAEKRRIVEEAFHHGASVADVARNYGLNANQVFNWRRTALAAAAKVKHPPAGIVSDNDVPATRDVALLPIGMIGQANDEGTSLVSLPAASEVDTAVSDCAAATRPAPDGRHGIIEIALVGGTRLRVDAFVNERALRRVLSVLKAMA